MAKSIQPKPPFALHRSCPKRTKTELLDYTALEAQRADKSKRGLSKRQFPTKEKHTFLPTYCATEATHILMTCWSTHSSSRRASQSSCSSRSKRASRLLMAVAISSHASLKSGQVLGQFEPYTSSVYCMLLVSCALSGCSEGMVSRGNSRGRGRRRARWRSPPQRAGW
jgi:hypothetical protein